MKLIALMPVRNEAWCVRFTIRAMFRWCDSAIVLDHASTDETPEVLAELGKEFGDRLTVLREECPDWNEAFFRQRLLDAGRAAGGTHGAIVDCDEVLTGNLLPDIRSMAETLKPGHCIHLPWFCLWRSLDQYRCDDSPFGRAFAPVIFRDAPGLSHRPGPDGYQLHTREPRGCNAIRVDIRKDRNGQGLMHLQHVNWRRVMAKQTWYREVDQVRWGRSAVDVARRYGPTTDEAGLELRDVPEEWWIAYGDRNIDVDAAWQER